MGLGLEEEFVEVEAAGENLARVGLADAHAEARGRQDEAVAGVEDQRGRDRHDGVRSLQFFDGRRRAERHAADIDLVAVDRDLGDEGVEALVEGDGGAQAALVVGFPEGVDVVESDAHPELVAEHIGLTEVDRVALALRGRRRPDPEELAAAGEAGPADHVVEARWEVGDVEVALRELQQSGDAETGTVARREAHRARLAFLHIDDDVPRLGVVRLLRADRQAARLRVDQLAVLHPLQGPVEARLVVLLAGEEAGARELAAQDLLARLRIAFEDETADVDLVVLTDGNDQVQLALGQVHDLVVVDLGLDVGPLSVLLLDLGDIAVGVVLGVGIAGLRQHQGLELRLGEDAAARGVELVVDGADLVALAFFDVDLDRDLGLVVAKFQIFEEDILAVLDVEPPLETIVELHPLDVLFQVPLDEGILARRDEAEQPVVFLAEDEAPQLALVDRELAGELNGFDADQGAFDDVPGKDDADRSGLGALLDAGKVVALLEVLVADVLAVLLEVEGVQRLAAGNAEIRFEGIQRDLIDPLELDLFDDDVLPHDERHDDLAGLGGVQFDVDVDRLELASLEQLLDRQIFGGPGHDAAGLQAGPGGRAGLVFVDPADVLEVRDGLVLPVLILGLDGRGGGERKHESRYDDEPGRWHRNWEVRLPEARGGFYYIRDRRPRARNSAFRSPAASPRSMRRSRSSRFFLNSPAALRMGARFVRRKSRTMSGSDLATRVASRNEFPQTRMESSGVPRSA